ncbi:MAG TPA: ACP phosphodiesterase [Clostridia bacterium]
MNYLAHIYLADNSAESMLGNLLGDFVHRSEDDNFEASIRNGILMHRKLDGFTDSHLVFLNSKNRISSQNRRFAGALIDMFYDHFLAKNWSLYSPLSLEEYTDNFYSILERFYNCLPERLKNVIPSMIKENWLLSYREIAGIEKALGRLSKKFSILDHSLIDAIDELTKNYEGFEGDFKAFFPEAIEYSNKLKAAC